MSEQVHPDGRPWALTDYPRPSVAVDTALLTVDANFELAVLQVRLPDDSGWALPGTFLHEGERLADAVDRCLRIKAGVDGLNPRQLQVFDELDRDPRGWVLSVAHVQVVRADQLAGRFAASTRLVPVSGPGPLPYDHGAIIELAVADIRRRYAEAPDPDGLLGMEFTLRQLRLVHEAVAGAELQRDWFRRTMEPQLTATGVTTSGGRGRPAELFRRS